MTATDARPDLRPVWLSFGAAILWGLWWLPIRALEEAGLPGVWAGIAMNLAALPLIACTLALPPRPAAVSANAFIGAIGIGLAITLYGTAVTETTVIRAVLLFYLAPAWSILIECVFFGRRFRLINAAGLAMAALGVLLIFGGRIELSGWSLGDSMALASGAFWAAGAAMIFTSPEISARRLSLVTCTTAALIGLLIGLTIAPSTPEALTLHGASLALGSGAVYLAPIVLATLWSARRLAPALLSFILTAEIVSGVGSSALLLDEPFGWAEALGSTLIAGAALIELLLPRTTQPA